MTAAPPSRPSASAPGDIAGLLLAAGGGRRLGGRPKALLDHRGELLVERAAKALRQGGCTPVHVVLGAAAEQVRARAQLPGCRLVDNQSWASGMGSSLRAGLASLPSGQVAAALVLLVDQPRIGPAVISRLRQAHHSTGAELVAACYRGARGHPVLFAARHWAEVAAMAEQDRGARDFLRAHHRDVMLVECSDIGAPDDIDTPDDLLGMG